MRTIRTLSVIGLAALAAGACTDITNPIEEVGTLAGPYVEFVSGGTVGTVGSTVDVTIQLPTRVEEDVIVDYSFGGDAVYGVDYIPVDADGNPRTDISESGGTLTIPFDFEDTATPAATLRFAVPLDATDGSALEISLVSAQTTSGREIVPGFTTDQSTFVLSFEGFVTAGVPVGTYTGTASGQISGDVTVSVSQPASPVTIDGVDFSFVISDYAPGLFTVAVPWAFNVTSGGTVVFAPSDAAGLGVTSDVEGSFDFDANNLQFDALLTNIAPGLEWSLDVTAQ